ncbi:hypothetical protein SAMN04487761_10188 [Lachnospiraceae bacterium C7]|nr:hypothetical protein SAMN04487761_10188 [Lachnospiraceae bacterium C7]
MNAKYIPAIVMLIAGLIDCIFAIINHVELFDFTLELLVVLLVFLVIGEVARFVVESNFGNFKDEEENAEEGEDHENLEGDSEENNDEVTEGNVYERTESLGDDEGEFSGTK